MKSAACMWMRGGTSKGGYFLKDDLPADVVERDAFLLRVKGSQQIPRNKQHFLLLLPTQNLHSYGDSTTYGRNLHRFCTVRQGK
jgi:PrpF protein